MASESQSGYSERQVQLIAVCTACLVLSTAAVGLRLLVRRFGSVANPWWDDWITVLALVCFVPENRMIAVQLIRKQVASWEVNIATLVGTSPSCLVQL